MTTARDQTATGQLPNGVGSQVITWATNPAAGSKVLVFVAMSSLAGAASSVKDNGTVQSTFTQDVENTAGGNAYVSIWRADGISLPASGSYQVTVTFGTSTDTGIVTGRSYTGVATGAPHASSGTGGGTSTSVNTGNVTPAASGSLVFGAFIDDSGVDPESITLTTSGASSLYSNTNGNLLCGAAADNIPASTSAQSLAWTLGDSVDWNTVVAVYSPASGTAHTATASLTVTPTFTAQRTHSAHDSASLTVSPSFTAQRTHSAHDSASLTVTPTFTAHASSGSGAALTVTPTFGATGSAASPPSTLFGQATETVTSNGIGNAGTIGLHFTVSTAATLGGIWLYSPSGQSLTQLPTTIGLYTTQASPTSGTLVTSNTASWTGAAGSGWVYAAFTSPPALASGTNYMATAFRNDAVNGWFVYTDPYTWPASSGPITAPDDVNPGQGWYNNTSTTAPIFPGSQIFGNWWLDVSVSASPAHTPTAALTVTPSFTATPADAVHASLTVTPVLSASGSARTSAHTATAALTISPTFASVPQESSNYGTPIEDSAGNGILDSAGTPILDTAGSAAAALTVTPAFTATPVDGSHASLTVTPSFAASGSAGASASLTVSPSFSASAATASTAALTVTPVLAATAADSTAASLTVAPVLAASASAAVSAALTVTPVLSASGTAAAAGTDSAALTVTPAFTATPAESTGAALTVTPVLSASPAASTGGSLTVVPVLAASPSRAAVASLTVTPTLAALASAAESAALTILVSLTAQAAGATTAALTVSPVLAAAGTAASGAQTGAASLTVTPAFTALGAAATTAALTISPAFAATWTRSGPSSSSGLLMATGLV